MPTDILSDDRNLVQQAITSASRTRLFLADHGLRRRTALAFQQLFARKPAVVIADTNTFAAAGKDVVDSLRRAGHECLEPFVFDEAGFHAEYRHIETLEHILSTQDVIAIAVGSGTINDLTKLASHHLSRPYMVVATAASMDGYTACGASITRDGSKQTFDCPAPVGLLADLEVIAAAPEGMNASGYADLLAKTVAGADWLVADALAVEPINATAWEMVQSRLRAWVGNPTGIRNSDPDAVHLLILGLVMSGLAMQWANSSRPASGAEHQFSHLWDMQCHVHKGNAPSHGFKVGIGTLVSSSLYEELLCRPQWDLNIDEVVSRWPTIASIEAEIQNQFKIPELATKALEETRSKYVGAAELRPQLVRLESIWHQLSKRLRRHLLTFEEIQRSLAEAGCPTAPDDIGISSRRLHNSVFQASCIRRRFTVLDLVMRTASMEPALDRIFGPQGRWPIEVGDKRSPIAVESNPP